MATYHLYHLRGGQLIASQDIEAASDQQAARIAEQAGEGDLVEVWNAATRVRIVRPAGAKAADAADEAPAARLREAPAV